MAKTDEQRGPVGAWLRHERECHEWGSGEVARLALIRHKVLSESVAKSTYAEWEAGTKRPNREQQAALERFYGTAPDTEKPGPSGEWAGLASALADALGAQAAYLSALTDEVRQLRSEVRGAVQAGAQQRDVLADSLGRLEGAVARLHELATAEGGAGLLDPTRQ